MTLAEIIADMEAAVYHRERIMGTPSGARVPYHGPLASATPGILRDVRWWIRHLKELK